MDWSIEDKVKNGVNFKEIFKSLILYSVSIFIAFWWKDYITEFINKFLPSGEGLFAKAVIGACMTVGLVLFVYFLSRGSGPPRTADEKKIDEYITKPLKERKLSKFSLRKMSVKEAKKDLWGEIFESEKQKDRSNQEGS